MSALPKIDDLDLTSLVSSRICHDLAGAIGAINNGLEVLEMDDDPHMQDYAMKIIRNSALQARAHLEFSRLAFGAAGAAGAQIPLGEAEKLARGYLGADKHQLQWGLPETSIDKNIVKVLLNLIAIGQQALPRGGQIKVQAADSPAQGFTITCSGQGAKLPDSVQLMMPDSAPSAGPMDSRNIQAYFSGRLANAAGLALSTAIAEDQVGFTAKPKV